MGVEVFFLDVVDGGTSAGRVYRSPTGPRRLLSLDNVSHKACDYAFYAINDGTSTGRVYHWLIGPRRLLSLDNVSHKACVMCLMRSAIAPRMIGSADRRMTRGECRRLTMCRAKSLFMHDAVNGGSRSFGCVGHRLTRGSCRCVTTSCTKSAFLCVNAIDCSPRAFECDCQSKIPWQLSVRDDVLLEAACLR